MTSPVSTNPTQRVHPLMIIAGTAVILFCAAGIAAIMGWIPTSFGHNADNGVLTRSDQLVQPASRTADATSRQAASVRHQRAREESGRQTTATGGATCANCGVVESVRAITTRAQGSGVGAAGGAVVGGLLGNQVGGGRGKDVMTIVGAIGGAVAGNQIEGRVNATHSYEVTVRLDDGSTRTIHQSAPSGWHSGDHVRIVDGVVRSND
ncbi:MAG TPA: glycine zipper 2TM domain-containing protein [Rhodocyclaceae bacterium]|nr:glycine zipper 2TM domain-containing protein [Rhodocyclaceae bacterium]